MRSPTPAPGPARRRIRMVVQFDGRPWQGWQRQGDAPTVQAALEEALARLLGEPVRIVAAGRTDAGVHAMALPVHFDTAHPIPAQRLPAAAGKFLPESIAIVSAQEAPPSFDARRGAILRWYRYQIRRARGRRPLGPRAWTIPHRLDVAAIERGLALLRGRHDFRGFRSSQCQARRTELTLEQASLIEAGELLALDFKCRSFLHHMVRLMVGSLAAMGRGRMDDARLLRILEGGERPALVYCAPPEGLCLMGVAYDEAERAALLAAAPTPPSF